jgi:hypothetical protein
MNMRGTIVFILTAASALQAARLPKTPKPAKGKTAVKAEPQRPISFRLDVMPVFFRAGCNSGGCHGAASGKDGFRLSLFSSDPAGDYYRLTQQMIGRRVDVAVPERSLLLTKATGKVPHTGGRRFKTDSEYYQTLLKWIEAGAPDDAENVPVVTGISLVPDKYIFAGKETTKPLQVMAKYSDGSSHNVTKLAIFMTNNKTTADVNENGLVTAGKRGDTYIFARFARYTMGAEIIVLPADAKFKWPKVAANNYIDELVNSKLEKLRIVPSGRASDEQFLRRAYLDLIGLPPTVAEYEKFMKTPNRAKLVDELMEREEFADLWAAKWSETLKVIGETNTTTNGADRKAAYIYYEWIREQMRKNTPLDKFVRMQVASTGSNFDDAPVNLYTMLPSGRYDPKDVAQDIAQLFTGIRIQCSQCHNHPFDRWSMEDYYGFVSFFTGVKRKVASEAREVFIYDDVNAAPAKHLLDEHPVPARFLGGDAPDVKGKDPRVALAEWLTSKDNVLFRQNMANRVWQNFFGRGIVEPVDDVRISNPPSNRELIAELGKRLAAYDFDMRKLIRDICASRTYQLASATTPSNRDDETQFSHAPLRRLRADTFLDAISQATGTVTPFGQFPAGFRATQLYEGGRKSNQYFLKTFGLTARASVNVSETRLEPTFSQALHLVNGDTIETKLARSTGITEMLTAKKKPEEIIENLYIRSMSRKPSAVEMKKMLALAAGHETDRRTYDDIFWALLNSTEFAFNH